MAGAKTALFVLLGVVGAGFLAFWAEHLRAAAQAPAPDEPELKVARPTLLHLAIGFVTNFIDTLGIGSYATTTALYRFFKTVPDRVIPGTLNVGHIPATLAEAFIFIAIVSVEMKTLLLMIAASVAGAWLGAGIVAAWPKQKVQLGMGSALLAAAILMALGALKIGPQGGVATGLEGPLLAVGLAGNFLLGALMTLGIGLFAPCMILVYFLGMSPTVAFPIMMGSCAFLMPVASIRFIRQRCYAPGPALGLAIGGVPAVLIAALIVKSLPLDAVRWLVVGVVVYTAAGLLRAAGRRS